jgi:hypothetical protein
VRPRFIDFDLEVQTWRAGRNCDGAIQASPEEDAPAGLTVTRSTNWPSARMGWRWRIAPIGCRVVAALPR